MPFLLLVHAAAASGFARDKCGPKFGCGAAQEQSHSNMWRYTRKYFRFSKVTDFMAIAVDLAES